MAPSTAESRPQARTAATRDKIERSAMAAFSEVGFDAASTREIARRADVKQQLITYLSGSKIALWKAAVDRLFGEFADRLNTRRIGLEGVDESTQTWLLLREFILFSAERPQVARFMMHEGAVPGPRLTWLYERHTRKFFEDLVGRIKRAQQSGIAAEGDPMQLVYIVLGAVAMFSHPAEADLMTKGLSRKPESLERYVELVLRLVLPDAPSPSG